MIEPVWSKRDPVAHTSVVVVPETPKSEALVTTGLGMTFQALHAAAGVAAAARALPAGASIGPTRRKLVRASEVRTLLNRPSPPHLDLPSSPSTCSSRCHRRRVWGL